jgi:Ser/Thr protein kinase RdoA (MazF antagonist)
LTYMPGRVPLRWGYFSDEQVFDAGRLLRAFHNATRGSPLAGQAEVVCHNDFGPNNTVLVAERPVAIIDFDMAAPGDPLDDVGYTAWAWCISSKAHRPPLHEQARQVRVLVDAYGDLAMTDRRAVVDAVLERQERNVRFWTDAMNNPEGVATPHAKISEIIEWSRSEAVFVRANRHQFEAALR